MARRAELMVTILVDPRILDACGLMGWDQVTLQAIFKKALIATVRMALEGSSLGILLPEDPK